MVPLREVMAPMVNTLHRSRNQVSQNHGRQGVRRDGGVRRGRGGGKKDGEEGLLRKVYKFIRKHTIISPVVVP